MRLSTGKHLDDGDLSRLIEQARWNSLASRARDATGLKLPGEIGLQLTNRCNLRCSHCFQWGETGQYHELSRFIQNLELDLDIIRAILLETRDIRSRLYVWGGEPLVYRRYGELMSLLAEDPRWTVVCTNGIGVERHIKAMKPASGMLTMLVSLDGFERQNDAMRTKGAFARTVQSIETLIRARRDKEFLGEISVAAVLSDDLIDELYEFARFVETLGVNTLHLNYPWHITAESARRMDAYYDANFAWLEAEALFDASARRSWWSYDYKIASGRADAIRAQLDRIHAEPWSMRLKVQPALQDGELAPFLDGAETAPGGRSQCISIQTRLSVLPSGRVTTCKLFPEFTIGDLTKQSVGEVWRSERAQRVRSILASQLTPVCSRCVQLYLNRPKADVLKVAHAQAG
jgi:MoaA/NifB/PqqE/SkfB family radical SAM enzyme